MNFSKREFESASHNYLCAFTRTADELGKEHPMVKFMGSLAWGRHGAERGPSQQTLRAAAVEYGFLRGCYDMLIKWCNATNDREAMRVLQAAQKGQS